MTSHLQILCRGSGSRRARRCANTRVGYRGGVQGELSVTGRVARLLLLACTAIGLAAMHIMGHGGSHTGMHHARGHADQPAAVPAEQPRAGSLAGDRQGPGTTEWVSAAAVELIDVRVGGCAGVDCRHAQPAPEPARHDLPAWSVCLAVLTGLSVAVLLAWLLIGRTTRAGGAVRRVVARLGESRAPPRPGFGLQQVSVSVIRT